MRRVCVRLLPPLCSLTLGIALGADVRHAELPDFKTHFQTPAYKSKKDWDANRTRVRQQILTAAGLAPMPLKTPLRPRSVRRLEYPGYAIEAIIMEPLPGYYLGGNLYLPTGRKGPFPAVLVPHGHWKHGRLEDLPAYSVPALCVNLARQGYVAFAYDMVGYNDTRQTPHSFESPAHALWSFHPMGLQLWNSIRVLDYLETLPQVDRERIGVTGASGGASQTIFLTAVDDRVKVAVPVNMVSAYMQGGDPCEEAPALRLSTSNVEIAALAAPRPMLLISCTGDWTRHTPEEEFPAIRHIYDLYGHGQDVSNIHFEAEHNYNRQSREAVYRFLAVHLKGRPDPGPLHDTSFVLPPEEQLLALPKGDLPPGTENTEEIFQSWKVAARLQTENGTSTGDLKDALRRVFAADVDPEVESGVSGTQVAISRTGRHDRVSGLWNPGKGTPVLLVDPAGSTVASRSELAREVLHSGRPLLIIDPFQPGGNRADQSRFDKYFLSYNRSDDAERVQDILTALAFLKRHAKGRPEIIGLGNAGIWVLFAAAIAPTDASVIADLHGFSGSDEDFRERFFVPGIQRAGGLSAAMRLVKTMRATIPAPSPTPSAVSVD
jgi:dienelactone hydrolase